VFAQLCKPQPISEAWLSSRNLGTCWKGTIREGGAEAWRRDGQGELISGDGSKVIAAIPCPRQVGDHGYLNYCTSITATNFFQRVKSQGDEDSGFYAPPTPTHIAILPAHQ
jgi:hypothetical protein